LTEAERYRAARSPDEREYIDLAVGLADRGELRLPSGEVAKRPPLYPAALSLIYRLQHEHWYGATILLQAMLACINTVLIALIAGRLMDSRAGTIAGVAAALYAPYLYLETLFLSETLLNFLLFGAVLLCIPAD